MGNAVSTNQTIGRDRWGHSTMGRSQKSTSKRSNLTPPEPESSRVLFLLYLIHRTWNVVVETVDPKSKRSRASQSGDSGAPQSLYDDGCCDFMDIEDHSVYGSQYSFCSCSYCMDTKKNPLYGHTGLRLSFCESEVSYCFGYGMAPSAGKSPPGTQSGPMTKISTEISVGWPPNGSTKENQRPPVYNAEDYTISLKKFARKTVSSGAGNMVKSIYDTSDDTVKSPDRNRSLTLPPPGKHTDYRSPIPAPPNTDCEMTLRQFGSITDLLTKLRADLRAAFPSFVQELVSPPLDGISLLLEVLRAIQLSQTVTGTGTLTTANGTTTIQRATQSYHRRALLDELACLQCINLCCTRNPDAATRLGTTPIGLLPLAASATGQGIRSRILALQLLTNACDKSQLSNGIDSAQMGHAAVSEALSTLRLRCAEPVRFRLLVGMLNSGGGSGELQAYGIRFLNTFLSSAENVQGRLYIQAELFQAGFDPVTILKTLSSSSWLERIQHEVKIFDDIKVDVDKLIMAARESDRIRSQMVILERRVQILQEEKTVLTSMERRLQERCAELQREIFRLQGAAHTDGYKSLEKRPVALPRQVLPTTAHSSKTDSSEHDDEGISSSETGHSLSPEPTILILPQKQLLPHKFTLPTIDRKLSQSDDTTTIGDVIDELNNIVEENVIPHPSYSCADTSIVNISDPPTMEKDIVPVNLLPQPPKKSRSLSHLISNGSDFDGSDYGLLLMQNGDRTSYFDDLDFEIEDHRTVKHMEDHADKLVETGVSNTNRELLNVIMDAREKDEGTVDMIGPSIVGYLPHLHTNRQLAGPLAVPTPPPPTAQKFNGVFFMSEMNAPKRYPPKPDIVTALEARRVSRNVDRIEGDGMADIVLTDKPGSKPNMYLPGVVRRSDTSNDHPQTHVTSTYLKSVLNSLTNQPIPNRNSTTRSPNSGSKLTDLPSGLY